jgi:hypothetical protein
MFIFSCALSHHGEACKQASIGRSINKSEGKGSIECEYKKNESDVNWSQRLHCLCIGNVVGRSFFQSNLGRIIRDLRQQIRARSRSVVDWLDSRKDGTKY